MIQSLTGLRFYAALLVFITHFTLFDYFFTVPPGPLFGALENLGALGVSVFFVLSGFILYVNYLAPGSKPLRLKSFYVARFARIYPVFFYPCCWRRPLSFSRAATNPSSACLSPMP